MRYSLSSYIWQPFHKDLALELRSATQRAISLTLSSTTGSSKTSRLTDLDLLDVAVVHKAEGEFALVVIMCDWNMPVMNGIEFLRKLREEGNAVKFGFVTTESTEPMRATAREAGAQFLIAKPFTAESFEKALRPVIG